MAFDAESNARDPFLERDVAIKVLDPNLGLTSELEEQFLREARVGAGVEHPHIIPLGGALPPEEAARLAHEVAMALARAHEHGVVHRDSKPDNVLLDGAGHATVTDFGISRVTKRPGGEAVGMMVGTPKDMSPEQAMGEEMDGRADVYSLGVMFYKMLTGALPFAGKNATERIAKHVAAPQPKVSERKPETPAAFVALVDQMLAKDRAARPTSAVAAACRRSIECRRVPVSTRPAET